MKTNFYKITLFLLVILSNTVFAQDILYIGDEYSSADSALIESLEYEYFLGTTVVPGNEYNHYDAIFISETVSSGVVVNYKKAGFPIPCVTNEGYAVRSDKWGFLSDDNAQFIQPKGAARTAGAFTLSQIHPD